MRRIERGGIRGRECVETVNGIELRIAEGVFAMPVVPDFAVTYQWLRELRRWRRERLVGVYFTLPSDQMVLVGRFGREKRRGPIGEVLPELLTQPAGAEILIPRAVLRTEVTKIRAVRQDVGWVENPDTPHKFDCVCIVCLPSGSARLQRRLRRAYQAAIQTARSASTVEGVVSALQNVDLPLERARGKLSPEPLLAFLLHDDVRVRRIALMNLQHVPTPQVVERVSDCLLDPELAERAVESLISLVGARRSLVQIESRAPGQLLCLVDMLRYTPGAEATGVLAEIADRSDQMTSQSARAALKEGQSE